MTETRRNHWKKLKAGQYVWRHGDRLHIVKDDYGVWSLHLTNEARTQCNVIQTSTRMFSLKSMVDRMADEARQAKRKGIGERKTERI